jgi:hypothetical protein
MFLSRALPYALALGEQEHWIGTFAELKGPPKIYWYGIESAGGTEEAEIRRVSEFTSALVGTFAATRAGRRLKA